jgi:DNA-binding SARP family transcriptional activator
MALAIHLLGPPRLLRDGEPVAGPRGRKAWALLAYLLLSQRAASRTHLADLLFGDADDPLGALRWNLSELRRALGTGELGGDPVAVPLPPGTLLDTRCLQDGSSLEAARMPGLDGALLEGLEFPANPAFSVWLATERRHLEAAGEAMLHEAALMRLAAGVPAEAADLAARLVRRDPLEENYQALLVRSLCAAGEGMAAARQAAACRELFRRELGVEPGAILEAALRTDTASPMTPPSAGRAAVQALIEAGEAAGGAGAIEAGLQCLRRAVVEADAIGDGELRAAARVALGGALVHSARGHDEEGAAALHEALAAGHGTPPAIAASRELGYVEFLRGRYGRALDWLGRARRLAGGDGPELARIAAVEGAALCDVGRYDRAFTRLREATAQAAAAGDLRRQAYAASMIGRAHLLRGELDAAEAPLQQAMQLARQSWTAFLPWPQALLSEVLLARGEVAAATGLLEHAFALGCQIGDPCWEGIAARGLGRVAAARGEVARARSTLEDALVRCMRLPDAYLWGKAYVLDALCELGAAHGLEATPGWVDELRRLAARSGMREMSVRALLHAATLGEPGCREAARLLSTEVDNPALAPLALAMLRDCSQEARP